MTSRTTLHDQPNYRASMPTKVIEYMAYGVPVIATPLPLVQGLLETSGAGILVPFQDAAAAARAVLTLRDDPDTRLRMAVQGMPSPLSSTTGARRPGPSPGRWRKSRSPEVSPDWPTITKVMGPTNTTDLMD